MNDFLDKLFPCYPKLLLETFAFVNLTSRLEGICDPEGIVVSHTTWALVKDEFRFEPRGEVTVKGFSHAILAHNLVLKE